MQAARASGFVLATAYKEEGSTVHSVEVESWAHCTQAEDGIVVINDM